MIPQKKSTCPILSHHLVEFHTDCIATGIHLKAEGGNQGAEDTSGFLQLLRCINYMGVSKNRGTPKWMVKIMENPMKMDDLGLPLFLETPIYQWIEPSVTLEKTHKCDKVDLEPHFVPN